MGQGCSPPRAVWWIPEMLWDSMRPAHGDRSINGSAAERPTPGPLFPDRRSCPAGGQQSWVTLPLCCMAAPPSRTSHHVPRPQEAVGKAQGLRPPFTSPWSPRHPTAPAPDRLKSSASSLTPGYRRSQGSTTSTRPPSPHPESSGALGERRGGGVEGLEWGTPKPAT